MRYPLFLNLADQPVVVIGAGHVASRKIRTLLVADANVTIISPEAGAVIRRLARTKRIRWVRRRYRRGDLRGSRLAIAATDDPAVNQLVCTEAKRRRVPVNCIAPPSAGNFIVPVSDGTATIDVTAKTGQTYRRVVSKLPLSGVAAGELNYVMYSDTNICKDFDVINNVAQAGCPY